jgi:hypothetical protein
MFTFSECLSKNNTFVYKWKRVKIYKIFPTDFISSGVAWSHARSKKSDEGKKPDAAENPVAGISYVVRWVLNSGGHYVYYY